MSLTATNAQVYKGTAAVTYGSGSGVSGSQLQGTATITYGGAPTSTTALSLPGTSGSVMNLGSFFPSKADPSSSNIFVEAWIYLPTGATGMPFTVSDSSTEDMGLLVNYSTSALQFRVWNTAGSGINSDGNGTALASSTWYHIAGSWDRTNNKVYGFVNGTVGTTVGSFSGTPRSRSTSNMTIGAGNSGTFFPFNGYIRDFRMVSGGIVPTSSFTPVAAPFRLNVPPYISGGSTVLSLYEQYFYPSWLRLPGTSGNYMTLGPLSPAHFDTRTSALFAEAWIYPLAANGSVNQQIMSVTDASSSDWNIYIGTDNVVHFGYWAPTYTEVKTGAITFLKWNHVAISWNPSTRAMYVFLNGVASGPTTAGATGVYTSTREFRIGSETTGSVFNGYIQDVRVVQGGSVPTSSFTPSAAPFGLASPTYVASMGTTVLSLATQYFQTNLNISPNTFFVHPQLTYPSYTTTSSPTFNTSNVSFNRASSNFMNFGSQSIDLTKGFTIMTTFAFTSVNSTGGYERIVDFGPAGYGNNIVLCRNNGTDGLYFSVVSSTYITTSSGFLQGTYYDVIASYNPSYGIYLYINGVLAGSGACSAAYTTFTNCYIGKSNNPDVYLSADIKVLKFYNRYIPTPTTISTFPYSQMTSRPVLPPVLINPGTQSFSLGQTFSISQTASEPLNSITWSLAPTGAGLAVLGSTDYSLNLLATTTVSQNVFTVTATNQAGTSTSIQFTGSTPLFSQVLTPTLNSAIGIYSLRSLRSTYALAVNVAKYPASVFAISGNQYTLTDNSAAPPDRTIAGQTTFNGTTQYTRINSILLTPATSGLTIYMNFKMNATTGLSIFKLIPDSGTGPLIEIDINTTPQFVFGEYSGGTWNYMSTYGFVVGTVYSIVLQISGTTMSVYINGTLVATNTMRVALQNVSHTIWGIGSWNGGGYTSMTLYGFAISNSLISPSYYTSATGQQDFYADTLGNLTTGAGTGQTLTAWLGGATGFITTWYDQSARGYHATQTNTNLQPVIQQGTIGPGNMILCTASQYLSAFAYSNLASTNYTVSKVDRRLVSISPVGNGSDNAVVTCGTNAANDQQLHVTYRSSTSYYYGQYGDDTSATITGFATGTTEPVRYGFTMASSISGSGRRIYVYGDPLGAVTNFVTTNTTLLSASGTGNFYIGAFIQSNPTYYYGELYEVIVFNSSLYDLDTTSRQITTIYNNQSGYISRSPSLPSGVRASGGTITSIGGNIIHTFGVIGTTTFNVPSNITANVLIVAGGGAGGTWGGAGGGGAGGLIYLNSISIPQGSYTVTVGQGGVSRSGNGGNSVFSTYTAIGGGGGATNGQGASGGSGGGCQSVNPGGSGTAGQGNSGGQTSYVGPAYGGGGGGGAGAAGQDGSGTYGGCGGIGLQYSISGSPQYYAGGGGGSYGSGAVDGAGGLGGGGRAVFAGPGIDGIPGTGGGGGASGVVNGSGTTRAGAGGSGIVIISYPSS
jgi:Concanavalin A-like lectin/glucanases superfamily